MNKRSHDPSSASNWPTPTSASARSPGSSGRSQDALKHYRSALDLWEPLADSDPENLEFQSRLADCDFAIGKLIVSENLPESLEWLDRALKIYERIATLRPTDTRFQSSLAACCSEMGLYLSYRKEVGPSLAHLNRARTILQKLVDAHPDQIDFKKDLAEIINRMGYVDFTRRDYPAALGHYKEFQKLCQEILDAVKVGPKPLKFQDMLARSYFNIATMYQRAGGCPAVARCLGEGRGVLVQAGRRCSLGHQLPGGPWRRPIT